MKKEEEAVKINKNNAYILIKYNNNKMKLKLMFIKKFNNKYVCIYIN